MDKYTLKTAFQKSFLGLVWRIEVDATHGLMAVETRDESTGTPRFSAIRYATGTSLLHETPYGDRNWTLAGVVTGKLILRTFGEKSPTGTGIACIDIDSGQVRWEQFNYTLLDIVDSQLLVRHRNFADGYEQYLDVYEGNLTPKNSAQNKPKHATIVIPKRHLGMKPFFLQGLAIVGDVFHCLAERKDVWAFHEQDEEGYRVRLIISSGLEVLADEMIMDGLTKMAPELFFMLEKQIFLIGDNKRKIVSYLV